MAEGTEQSKEESISEWKLVFLGDRKPLLWLAWWFRRRGEHLRQSTGPVLTAASLTILRVLGSSSKKKKKKKNRKMKRNQKPKRSLLAIPVCSSRL